jgi:acetate kinase
MAAVLRAEAAGNADASLAIEVYLHRLRAEIAAMAAAMGGLDALAFTGGVGEHASSIRARAAQGLTFLGIEVDADANDLAQPDTEVSASGARVRTFVIEAREDLQILRDIGRVLASRDSSASP